MLAFQGGANRFGELLEELARYGLDQPTSELHDATRDVDGRLDFDIAATVWVRGDRSHHAHARRPGGSNLLAFPDQLHASCGLVNLRQCRRPVIGRGNRANLDLHSAVIGALVDGVQQLGAREAAHHLCGIDQELPHSIGRNANLKGLSQRKGHVRLVLWDVSVGQGRLILTAKLPLRQRALCATLRQVLVRGPGRLRETGNTPYPGRHGA